MAATEHDQPNSLPKNEFSGGRLALDFCNTFSRGPGRGPRDRLAGPEAVLEWSSRAGLPLAALPTSEDVTDLHGLRSSLFGIFDRLAEGEAPDPRQIGLLNEMIASARGSERLVPQSNGNWRFMDASNDHLARLRHAIVMDAAEILTGEVARLKRCPAHDCLWLFYDTSKNLSRRWCAMDECGSRAKMRRHRARHHH